MPVGVAPGFMKLPSSFQPVAATSAPRRFVDQLLDSREFVQRLYATDPNLLVQHDITEVGKLGARRPTDVKITQRAKLHTDVTLVVLVLQAVVGPQSAAP